jgi:integrase
MTGGGAAVVPERSRLLHVGESADGRPDALSRADAHETLQERLGHASIAITLDTYTHASPAIDAAAAEQIAALIA